MVDRPRSTLHSAFEPMTPEEADFFSDVEGIKDYRRLRAAGRGTHSVTATWLRQALGTRTWTDTDWKLRAMDAARLLLYEPQRYGDKHMATVTLRHLDSLTADIERNTEFSGDVLQAFLNNFGFAYRTKVNLGFYPTGKDRRNAVRILKMAGGRDEAERMMRVYFNMPYEHRGDNISFTGFYLMVPEIMTQESTEQEYEDRRERGARAAASRNKMASLEEMDAEVERFRVQRERIEAYKRRKAEGE